MFFFYIIAYFLLNMKNEGVKQWHKKPQIETSADLKVCETQCIGIPLKMF